MKNSLRILLVSLAVILTHPAYAVEGLDIRVQGNDVVLEWNSDESANYLISHRPTYETNDVWSWLSICFPAATGTNRTVFIHTNGAECSGDMLMMSGGEGGGTSSNSESGQGSPFAGKSSRMSTADYELPKLPWSEKQQEQIAVTYPGLLPLLPWDEKDQQWIVEMHELSLAHQESGGMALMSSEGCSPGGFYKVVAEGVTLIGVTNGTVFSGMVDIPVEVGWPSEEPLLFVGFQPAEEDDAPEGARFYYVDATSRLLNKGLF
jgi:hypothetical protein